MRRPPPPSTLQKTIGRPFSSPRRTILSLGDGVPDFPSETIAQSTAADTTTNERITKITLRFVIHLFRFRPQAARTPHRDIPGEHPNRDSRNRTAGGSQNMLVSCA